MDRPALRRILLDLIGTAAPPDLGRLTQGDWIELDRLAEQHRLQPLLHARYRHCTAIPTAVAATWQGRHRDQAMLAMVQQAELVETCVVLQRAGIPSLALKGAALRQYAYPEPAQRPLRDLDLLVIPDQVIAAFNTLLSSGYRQDGPSEMTLAETIRFDKHLPPLIAPRGTVVELHHSLWEHDGRLDHASPAALDPKELFARTIAGGDGILYPDPYDLLVHLIVHAVYSHRLDCGPLILTDIDHLLRAAQPDWARFWTDAEAHGWQSGALLLLELTALYYPGSPIDLSAARRARPTAEMIAAAPDLLLQDLNTRASAGFGAAMLISRPARLMQRLTGHNQVAGQAATPRQMHRDGGPIGWAVSRARRSLRDLSQADVRRQSRQLAALSKWLSL